MLKTLLIGAFISLSFLSIHAQVPAGYYDGAYISGSSTPKTCADLKTALFNITSAGVAVLPYNGSPSEFDTRDAINSIDIHRNDANTADIIWDMYTDNPAGPELYTFIPVTNQCGNYAAIGDCYNREHSFPRAWFDDADTMFTDMHHLFGTDGYTNGKHDNNPYGDVDPSLVEWESPAGARLGTSSFPGYTGKVFEPIDEYKGDFARAMFYMVTRYENKVGGGMSGFQGNANADQVLDGTTWPSLDAWAIRQWYKWHIQDPVSQKEIDRNNAIYNFQHNRNPFIDHPEFVALIWQCNGLLPVTLLNFTASNNNSIVTLHWNVASEVNFKEYVIERSTDGLHFSSIGEVTAKSKSSYSFIDNNSPVINTIYYRLKMMDIDGRFTYSKIVPVKLNLKGTIVLSPNPARENITLAFKKPLAENARLKITDVAGKELFNAAIAANQNNVRLSVNKFPSGRYFISIVSAHTLINESFVVIK